MKKMMVMVLVLMLGMFCFAEEAQQPVLADFAVVQEEEITADLDGDGTEENLSWFVDYDDENYIETVYLSVYGEGKGADWFMELYTASVYVLDIDGDGIQEIFVTGDQMSSDYLTVCLQFREGKLLPTLFEDANRGENSEEALFSYGYGLLMSAEDGKVVLTGSQDILGTYFGSRTFELNNDMFVLADDGLWVFERDLTDAETWEFAAISPVQDIPATIDGAEGVIAAGEKFIVTASDKVSIVYFAMEDGRTGYFAVEPDTENGYGCKVNGVSEWELFEMLPYAD